MQPSYLKISLHVTFSWIMKDFEAVKVITAPYGPPKFLVSAFKGAIFKLQSSYRKYHALGAKSWKHELLLRVMSIMPPRQPKTSFSHYFHYKLNSVFFYMQLSYLKVYYLKPFSR